MIVLFIVVDSLRSDAPSFAGGEAKTPLMDRLASEGAWFADLFASGASTLPSLISLLTGSFPHRVGVGRWRHPFPARRPTLMTAFAAAGFRVACFSPHPKWGFLNTPGAGSVGDSQDENAILSTLGAVGSGDLLLVIHHWWTHLPYITRALDEDKWHAACDFSLESLGRHPSRVASTLRRSYHRSITFFSEELLGRYLDAAGSGGREVLLVLTGDHGENWGEALPPGRRIEHVYDLHGRWLADTTIRVPLLLWGKGIPARGRLDGMIQGVDLTPTVADLASVAWTGPLPLVQGPKVINRGIGSEGQGLELAGRSLAPWIATGVGEPAREAMTVTTQNAYLPLDYPSEGRRYWRTFGLRTEDAWIVWDGVEGQLQVTPLGNEPPPDPAALGERLAAEHRRALDGGPLIPEPDGETSTDHTDPVADRLRTLGYLE